MVTMASITRHTLKQPWLIMCSDCKMQHRVENLTPYTMATRKFFCVSCGSPNVIEHSDYDNDRWYSMARSFGLSPMRKSVDLIKQLYNLWDVKEHEHFPDFVREILEEMKGQQESGKGKNNVRPD